MKIKKKKNLKIVKDFKILKLKINIKRRKIGQTNWVRKIFTIIWVHFSLMTINNNINYSHSKIVSPA